MTDLFKEFKCKIEVISPVHIGDGNELLVSDYVFNMDEVPPKIYPISYDKLYEFLEERGLAERFLEYIEKAVGDKSLENFLMENRLLRGEVLKRLSNYVAVFSSEGIINRKMGEKQKRRIATCIKDVYNKPYIPGSEVKGAIRTALLYSILKNNRDYAREIVEMLRSGMTSVRSLSEHIDGYLRPKIRSTLGDLGRLLRLSDSEPIDETHVVKMYLLSSKRVKPTLLTFAEIISPHKSTVMELTIMRSRKIAEVIGGDLSISDVVKACKAKSYKVIRKEVERTSNALKRDLSRECMSAYRQLSNFYERLMRQHKECGDMETLIRVGGGQGLYSTTVLSALIDDYKDPIFVELVRLLSSSPLDRRKKSGYVDRLRRLLIPIGERPYSMKVADVNGQLMPFGWIKVVFEEC